MATKEEREAAKAAKLAAEDKGDSSIVTPPGTDAPATENDVTSGNNLVTDNIPGKKVEKSNKEEMIEIKRSDFEKMMKQLEKQSKDIDLLYKTTDKSRLAKELNKDGENLIKQVKLATWDDTGRIIIASKLITNKCEVIMGKWYEDQTISFSFEDGEIKTVPYLEFVRKTIQKVTGDVIAKTEELDAQNNKITIFKVQLPTGKTLLINSAFVNL